MCNFKYRYYARIDYKSCFDSVYSHVFKWIIERITTDSKDAENSNLFITIDRILQNINGLSSNGLIVGPEFSRMIAEILLQHIDSKVLISLENYGVKFNKDYIVYRYVDDIFLFSTSQEYIEIIINIYQKAGKNFLMNLNELKIEKGRTPCLPKGWFEKTQKLSDVLKSIFFKGNKAMFDLLPDDERFLIKPDYIGVDRIKDEITILMKEFPDDQRTIVSYLLSVLLNNISKKKDGYNLFKNESSSKANLIIDMALFIYAFCPSFEQTRKLISMISYMNDEVCFKNVNSKENKILKSIIHRYSFIFINGNFSDLCDWFLFFSDYNISLDIETENMIIEKIKNDNNPIDLANSLMYSKYNESFFDEMKYIVDYLVYENLERISLKNPMLQKEFWYVLVFHNCPYITPRTMSKIDEIIRLALPARCSYPSETIQRLVCEYLQLKSATGVKPKDSLFNWSEKINISEQITFRTFQKTIFKNYKGNKYGLYASI
jgi:hypothetical protein